MGAGDATVAGDGGFGRSASSGAIILGGTSDMAQIDFGVSTAGTVKINQPMTVTGAASARIAGSSVTAPLPPSFSATGAAQPATMKIVTGTFQTNLLNPAQGQSLTLLGQIGISLTGAAVFLAIDTYAVSASWYEITNSGAAPSPISIVCITADSSSFEIQVYGETSSNTSGVTIMGTFTAIGY